MRLKTLRLKGFKSFADETLLNFDEQVVGVVGPNGSGKSNIVDAIRWVLGEQKGKELRLQHMGDVVFNGTKKRKPAKMAQVTMEFDNDKGILPSEFKSVSISRILYKSGESEYRLNDVKCRLKDITNLFVDTGIGSNSYAIIELGMVDDILSDKDRARRKMFEQAAGISKYKKRKRETVLKLKSTSEDLERVEDLLFEIENNLKQLEKQARKAKRYVDLKAKYKDVSIQLALLQTRTYKEEYNEIKGKINELQVAITEQEARLSTEEAKLEERKRLTLDNEKEVSEAQRVLNALMDEIRTLEGEKSMLRQRMDFVTQNASRLRSAIESMTSKEQELTDKINAIGKRIKQATVEAEQAEKAMREAADALDEIKQKFHSAQSALDTKLQEKQQLEARKYELEKQEAIRKNAVETYKANLERLRLEIQDKKKSYASLQQEWKVASKESKSLETGIREMETAEEERGRNIETLRGKILALNEELGQVGRLIDSRQNEYDLLKSMVDQLEGFPESIKYLNKKWPVKAPLLTDVIDVPERYRSAIEQYLEPLLNNYIVRDETAAMEAISMLSGTQKGTAKFFVLSKIPPRVQLKAEEGWVDALSVVDTDEMYLPLFRYLLYGVFFVEQIPKDFQADDDAVILIQPERGTIRTVCSVSGGSVGLFSGKKIGRKKQLEKLEKELRKYKRKAEGLTSKVEIAKSKLQAMMSKDSGQRLKELRQAFAEQNRKATQLGTKLEHTLTELKRSEERVAELEEKIAAIGAQSSGNTEDKDSLIAKIAQLDKVINEQGGDVKQWNDTLSKASTFFNQCNIEYFKKKNLVENLSKEQTYFAERLQDLQSSAEEQEAQLQQSAEELVQSKERMKAIEESLTQQYEKRIELQSQLKAKESGYYEVRNAIIDHENLVKQLRKQVQDLHASLADYREKYNNLKLKLTAIGERINIEFGLSIDYLMKTEVPDDLDLELLTEQVEKLRRRLDNFGEVNPLAMQAYDEMKERYDTITAQKQDILDAKVSLETTIEEIEKKATLLFLDAFGKVKEHFQSVFRSLFTEGDDCDLILVDPEDPLNSEIEIIAKPKGKRPKTLSQLSGGEKTLTATALLFALYLLKPAPFCIFDEVDAPLDDANILKFNNIISEFSKQSQFIIVTHNKMTMAEVDVLYGVFMQENGVSAVSEVDFRKLSYSPLIEDV